jgi:copper chaperone
MTFQIKVSDMACAACVTTITHAVKSVDPSATVEADLQTKFVKVKLEPQQSQAAVKEAIAAAGYTVTD